MPRPPDLRHPDLMRQPAPLPSRLRSRAFSTTEGLAAAVGEGRMRGRDLARPFLGVRQPLSVPDLGIITRCRGYEPLLRPGQFFSHTTAARLWGCPLPERSGEPLHVSVPHPGRAPRSAGLIGHQSRAGRVVLRQGFPCSDPVNTWLALASALELDELVVAGDHLLLDPYLLDPYDIRPYASLEEVAEAVERFHGRGARAAASALPLLSSRAESRTETLLRLLLLRAGLPMPEVNPDIFDESGQFIARADLVFREWRTIAEYDGEHHRLDDRQYEADLYRLERLRSAGWAVVQVRKRGLFERPDETVARVVRELRAHGWPG